MAVKSLLSKALEAMLNEAVHAELYASNLYRHLANQAQRMGYFGAQKHFSSAASEEVEHYQKLADYMNDRGSVAKVPALEAITDKVGSMADMLEAAFEAELDLERNYVRWYKNCECEITKQFLLDFLEEQRKAVGEYGDLISRLDRAGDNEAAILLIDQELGS